MTYYAGTEDDYGVATVTSLANDIEAALLALFPEAAGAEVKLRKKLVLTFAQGIIAHLEQHIDARVTEMGHTLTLTADRVVMDAAAVELGAGGGQHAVRGDVLSGYLTDLVNAYNAHGHDINGNTGRVSDVPGTLLSGTVTLE